MPRRLLIAGICAILAFHCVNPEKRKLENRLAELQAQRASIELRLTERRSGIAASERRLNDLRADLAKSNGETEAFLMDHKMATACIGAAAISLGEDNVYAEDVEEIAGWGTFFCMLALSEESFVAEVAAVADRLVQASEREKNLEAQMATIRSTLANERAAEQNDQAELDQIIASIDEVNGKLAQM